jgi:hypothetical protein
VFKVQADVAGQVVGRSMSRSASPSVRRSRSRPTANAAAYDAYLKGEGGIEAAGDG